MNAIRPIGGMTNSQYLAISGEERLKNSELSQENLNARRRYLTEKVNEPQPDERAMAEAKLLDVYA